MPRREASHSESESDNESEFSDIDYNLDQLPTSLGGISLEKSNELFNKQSGCCYISHIPLAVEDAESIYAIDVAPRRISEPLSDANCVLVNKGVRKMHEASGLTWTQFKAFLSLCAGGLE